MKKKLIKLAITVIILILLSICSIYMMFPMKYKEDISKYSKEYDIDPFLVSAIINVESGFDKNAKSHKDARGLMQIREITGNWASENISMEIKEEDYYNPEHNIQIGCWYISVLRKQYGNSIELIAAAYNAGMGNVNKWIDEGRRIEEGDVPFEETKNYILKVKNNYKIYKILYKDFE